MGNVHMEATQINYREGNKKMSVAQAIKNAGSEITPEEKEWIDTIPELASQEIIAPEFDAEEGVYAVGDLVIYQGGLYQFTTAHETAGAWNAEEVAAVKISDELDSLKSGLTNVDVALDVPKGTGKNRLTITATTTTTNGVTFTVNDDGTVTLNGETTATDTNFTIFNPWTFVGNYILNGVPESAPIGTKLQAFMTGKAVEDTGSGVALNVVSGDTYRIRIVINGTGIVFNNVTIKPMLRLASVSDPTFAPYIPSVESRLEALEAAIAQLTNS